MDFGDSTANIYICQGRKPAPSPPLLLAKSCTNPSSIPTFRTNRVILSLEAEDAGKSSQLDMKCKVISLCHEQANNK